MSFTFERLFYEEARTRCADLVRPRVDEVRWVKEEVIVDGDFSLDEGSDDELFAGAWVFAGGLTVGGALTNAEMDSGPVLYVRHHLRARRWWLTGCIVHIAGTLEIERLLIAEYNHGALVVDGPATAPLLLNLDFDLTLRGGFRGEYVDGHDAAEPYLPALKLWEVVADDLPPIRVSPREVSAREGNQLTDDPTFRVAKQLIEHWLEAGKILLVQNTDMDALANELAVTLENLGAHYDAASALHEWLMESDAVEDVLVEDAELLPSSATHS